MKTTGIVGKSRFNFLCLLRAKRLSLNRQLIVCNEVPAQLSITVIVKCI